MDVKKTRPARAASMTATPEAWCEKVRTGTTPQPSRRDERDGGAATGDGCRAGTVFSLSMHGTISHPGTGTLRPEDVRR